MPAGKLEMSFLSCRPELIYVQKFESSTMSALGDKNTEAQLDLGCVTRTLATQPLNFALCSTPVGPSLYYGRGQDGNSQLLTLEEEVQHSWG